MPDCRILTQQNFNSVPITRGIIDTDPMRLPESLGLADHMRLKFGGFVVAAPNSVNLLSIQLAADFRISLRGSISLSLTEPLGAVFISRVVQRCRDQFDPCTAWIVQVFEACGTDARRRARTGTAADVPRTDGAK